MGDKLDDAIKSNIDQAIEKLKKSIEGEDTEEIKKLTEELTQASHKLAETIYANANQEQAQAQGQPDPESDDNAPKDDDVVDADFEEVKK